MQFDSDTNALIQREAINRKAKHDLEQWSFSKLTLKEGMKVLDLGCGTGKQVFALHELDVNFASITGVDVSQQAVDAVNKRAEAEGLSHIRAVQLGLDDVVQKLCGNKYNLIISSYAIYYASDLKQLLIDLKTLLSPEGQLFICGPGEGSNQQLFDLIAEIRPETRSGSFTVDDFLLKEHLIEVGNNYTSTKVDRLLNQVEFDSVETFLNWWRNHNSFILEIELEMTLLLERHFLKKPSFFLDKNVIGIRYVVG